MLTNPSQSANSCRAGAELDAARQAVALLMGQLEPYPALLVDRCWNTLKMNPGAKRFLALFPGCDSGTPHNGRRLVFHPQGLRPFYRKLGARSCTHNSAGVSRSCRLQITRQ